MSLFFIKINYIIRFKSYIPHKEHIIFFISETKKFCQIIKFKFNSYTQLFFNLIKYSIYRNKNVFNKAPEIQFLS